MRLLAILLPPRPRGPDAVDLGPETELNWVFSTDGLHLGRQGRSPARQMPRADRVVLVPHDVDIAWHRVDVPKAPAGRLRAALGAVLEEQLLDDEEALHLALEPGLHGGRTGWVAATSRSWLEAGLKHLQSAGLAVDRVVPPSQPAAPPTVHALPSPTGEGDPLLVFADDEGLACLRMAGSLARHRLNHPDRSRWRVTAHPAAAAAAEQWLESPVAVLGDGERALAAARGAWNLLQFDLAPQHRGLQALRDGLRRLGGPEWRPLRWGLVALAAVQLVGLNLWAWRLDQSVQDKRRAMVQLLQTTHPQVRAVLDAPVQMQRETDALRTAAGRPGAADLEALLSAAARGWPEGQPPMQGLRFEPGRLTIGTGAWTDAQRAAFAERVRSLGYRTEGQAAQVVLLPGSPT
ncbi:MAG: general secretion pathway protein GspL [Rubrivivax sp.]|nr:general secretion pathway protein GspL [Rubrivivax sp.]